MTIILSISAQGEQRWAAGPYGLFALDEGGLIPTSQPMERLIVCSAIRVIMVASQTHVSRLRLPDRIRGKQWTKTAR